MRARAGIVLLALAGALACSVSYSAGPRAPDPKAASAPASPAATLPAPSAELGARAPAIAKRLSAMAEQDFAFWRKFGPDREHGGFHATLDREGKPIEPTDKGLIQTARQLWAMSLWAERKGSAEARELADELYRFLMAHFYDRASREFHFKVSRAGAPVDTKKVLYAQSFAVYALTRYATASGKKEAGKHALACFLAFDQSAHDAEHGGYQRKDDPPWLTPGAAKETNTHLHLLEALSALYAYSPHPTVKARLEELLGIFLTKIVQPDGYARKDFLRDFTPFGEPVVSYGHDLETAWLLLEAAEALGRPGDPAVVDAARRLAAHSASAGFDEDNGGYFEEGVPGGAPTKTEKIWWIQAEAIPALYWLQRLTGEEAALRRLERTLDWIEKHQRDRTFGEWYWGVLPDGRVGPRGTNKGEEWKTSYHTLRALVFTEGWLKEKR